MEDVLIRTLVNSLKYKRAGGNKMPLKFTVAVLVCSVYIKTILN